MIQARSKGVQCLGYSSKDLEILGYRLEILMFVAAPAPLQELLPNLAADRLGAVVNTDWSELDEQYLHWDKLRHLDPPAGLSHEEWWIAIKLSRSAKRRFPLRAAAGGALFYYLLPDVVLERLHHIDQRCSGEIAMEEVVTADGQVRQHYLVNSLMEEAIRSSQLEGATTSRRAAKDLLRSGREPKDRSERMILNNYRALHYMRDEMGDTLAPAAVLELQRILTAGTLENPDAAGRLQTTEDERVGVFDKNDGSLLHSPPPVEELPDRLEALCEFANDSGETPFMHPVVKAILLHFWLAYDHPFEDGNGRTARALFYWYMRTRGYWLVEYLSISRILRKAPAKYSRSFLLTETDDGDTTYFLIYQLGVMERAIDELHTYLRRKIQEVRGVERLFDGASGFNHRQLALLGDALRNPERSYSFGRHAASHQVTHETARTDLRRLVERGLLDEHRVGRRYVFTVPVDLADRARRVVTR